MSRFVPFQVTICSVQDNNQPSQMQVDTCQIKVLESIDVLFPPVG